MHGWVTGLVRHQLLRSQFRRLLLGCSLLLGGLSLWAPLAQAQSSACLGEAKPGVPRLVVAVVPQLPPTEILKRWSPALQEIGRKTGLCFELQISPTIPTFEQAFLKGTPDLAFMNPYHQVMAKKAQGYLPLLADEKLLTGLLVVQKDSPIHSLKELSGKTIGFPAPNSFAASLLIRGLLEEQKVAFTPSYVKTHSNVFRGVAIGDLAAGGGVNNTLTREPDGVRLALRVLYETPGFRAHPLSAHPRVSPAVREAVQAAFLALSGDEHGRELLNQIQIPRPALADYQKDYAPLERLGLDRLVVVSAQ